MRIAGDIDTTLVESMHKKLAGRTERVVLRIELKVVLEDIIREER